MIAAKVLGAPTRLLPKYPAVESAEAIAQALPGLVLLCAALRTQSMPLFITLSF